jgi:cellulose synthase/poly-beta-1,6-N-acetylglucosamine synthase-like glycosyltransferase
VEFTPDPVAWTEGPESIRILARQRNRWFRGLLDVLARHRTMLWRPRYRSAGLLGMPYYLVVEAVAPVCEAVGLIVLGVGALTGALSSGALAFVLMMYFIGASISLLTLIFDEFAYHSYHGFADRALLCVYALIEQFVYRPLTLVWRMWGLISRMRGDGEWGAMQRTGYKTSNGV